MFDFEVPVPMFGVYHADRTIACGPTDHISRAAEWYELEHFHSGCVGELSATSDACKRAYMDWCTEKVGQGDYMVGALFHVTARPWISCFRPDHYNICRDLPEVDIGFGNSACFTPSFVIEIGSAV